MDYTLLVLAAGEGSRFGGLKQVAPVGPNGEFLIDYSIYDAIKAGFTRVIFVIDEAKYEFFRSTIGRRLEGKIKVEYAFQSVYDVPLEHVTRVKPWGSGHAIYAARDLIKGSFAVINADDFYGYSAFESLIDFMKNNSDRTHYLAVCYKVASTLSSKGEVKRGVVSAKNGVLEEITESKIRYEGGKLSGKSLVLEQDVSLDFDTLATVNLFAFTPSFLKAVIDYLPEFLKESDDQGEYLIPDIVNRQILNGSAVVYVRTICDKWHGMTYAEDLEGVKGAIDGYIKEGKYPKNLWE